MREGDTAPSRGRREDQISFQHTQLGVYLAGAFGLLYLWSSSAQVMMPAISCHVLECLCRAALVDNQASEITCSRLSPPAVGNLGT
jgi:hypothetical protein